MDISELLAFKPVQTPKRNVDDRSSSDEEDTVSKRVRLTHSSGGGGREGGRDRALPKSEPALTQAQRDDIMHYVESQETQGDVIDESAVKKLVLMFEKRALRNREMRIKFPDQPDRFMDSELDLHNALQELSVVATVPDQYPTLVQMRCIPSLLELLSHDNTDIAVQVIHLLQELTDVDILHESSEGAETLVEALLEGQAIPLLLHNISRLDEGVAEEREGVHNTLSILENMTEFRPQLCRDVASQGFMQWLLKRLKMKAPFDGNKLYASEMLSILLQDCMENRILLGELDGIDVLLQQLAFYKRHDPSTGEEQEMMENLFNCVCSSLMHPSNRERFLRGEGLQLMNLMLREKKLSRNGSLKVLDHAMSGPDGKDNCNKFVDILGLRTIFPLFMKTPKRKRLLTTDQHEEHVVSIIASMLRNCQGAQRQRLLTKFTENDLEKVDRLMELHFKYLDKVDQLEQDIERQRQDDDETEPDEEDLYLRRLSGGLFILQLVDYIMLEVCCVGGVKQRVQQVLTLRGGSLKTVRHIMREYAGNLGDAANQEWREEEQQHILQMVDKF